MEEKKLTYRDFIDMVRADNEAKNADRATRKNLYIDAKNKYEDYLRGEFEKEKKDKQSMEEKKYVNEEGQFDFKKFVADGALEKNLNEMMSLEDKAIEAFKYLHKMGRISDEELEYYINNPAKAKEDFLDQETKGQMEKDARKDRFERGLGEDLNIPTSPKNKDRYIGKHGPIFKVDNEEKIDFLQSITDPGGYGFDDADYDREEALYDEAKALGTLPQLKRMLSIYHWGREGGLSNYDQRNRKDPLGDRNEKRIYRFKKDGEMYKVDKASMKGTAKGTLKDLKRQSQVMKDKGRQLPEFTLKEIDEMLKEARSKDNK